jgi:hypothetical protein
MESWRTRSHSGSAANAFQDFPLSGRLSKGIRQVMLGRAFPKTVEASRKTRLSRVATVTSNARLVHYESPMLRGAKQRSLQKSLQ